jgi:diguanylate cyclase (GGDEF)-like protein
MPLNGDRKARAREAADQSAADLDQTQSDADQTASDADQDAADAEQMLADRDQHASDSDQAVADLDVAARRRGAGRDGRARAIRDAATRERADTAAARLRTAGMRLATASHRDDVADVRDRAAAARDRAAKARDDAADARDRAAEARERLAIDSGQADDAFAELRALRLAAAEARRASALERETAARDREAAAADRRTAAAERRDAALDDLTRVFRRGTGELALTNEIERARRLGRPSVFAIIDVDGLKAVNDNQGHPAGDALLRDVAAAITSSMRSYDIAVRWGGDEFVCALSDVTLDVASVRMDEIRQALNARQARASVSVGLAETDGRDSLEVLVARADASLYRARGERDSA